MGTRLSFALAGFFCVAASVSCFGDSASDEHVENDVSVDVPHSDSEVSQTHLTPVPAAPAELFLTPLPPGTLGQTYTRPSHPIPIDEHPRTGMLAVRDLCKVPYLSVITMGGIKMKSGIWLFESSRPLDPGACQIVRVEARRTPQDIEPYATKFVRLIPGRIVYLDF